MSSELKWKIVGDQIGHQMTTKEIVEMYAADYGFGKPAEDKVEEEKPFIPFELEQYLLSCGMKIEQVLNAKEILYNAKFSCGQGGVDATEARINAIDKILVLWRKFEETGKTVDSVKEANMLIDIVLKEFHAQPSTPTTTAPNAPTTEGGESNVEDMSVNTINHAIWEVDEKMSLKLRMKIAEHIYSRFGGRRDELVELLGEFHKHLTDEISNDGDGQDEPDRSYSNELLSKAERLLAKHKGAV